MCAKITMRVKSCCSGHISKYFNSPHKLQIKWKKLPHPLFSYYQNYSWVTVLTKVTGISSPFIASVHVFHLFRKTIQLRRGTTRYC